MYSPDGINVYGSNGSMQITEKGDHSMCLLVHSDSPKTISTQLKSLRLYSPKLALVLRYWRCMLL